MLTIEPIVTLQGVKCRGFFVRNSRNKVLAMGATSTAISPGFVLPHAKRYARDVSLCAALGRVTGLPVKWNLHWNGKRWQS